MNLSIRKTLIAGLNVLWAFSLLAAPQKCPSTIEVEQKVRKAPPGWTVSRNAAPARLTRVALYDGPPREKASLKPDNGDTEEAPTWTLSPDNPRGYWLVCYYDDTTVALSKRLPAGISSCREILDAYSAIVDVDCRP